MAESSKLIDIDVLRSTRASIDELRVEMKERFGEIRSGLSRETRTCAGTAVILRATAGHFEERIRRLEERIDGMQRRHD